MRNVVTRPLARITMQSYSKTPYFPNKIAKFRFLQQNRRANPCMFAKVRIVYFF